MSRAVRLVVVTGIATLWVAMLTTAPLAATSAHPVISGVGQQVYAASALVCHQRPDRSFHLGDTPFPVCARCAGLYVSGLLGVLAWVSIAGGRRHTSAALVDLQPATWRWVLTSAALPTIISVGTAWLGWWDPPNAVRALLAVPLGVVIGMIVAAFAARDLR